MGQGLNIKIKQITAEYLHVDEKFIRVCETCTKKTANCSPTSASSGFDLNAAAVTNALDGIIKNMGDNYEKFKKGEISWPACCNSTWF